MHSIRVLGTAAISLLAVLAISAPTSAAHDLRGTHGGNAYGIWANAASGSIATELGRSAFQPCPCKGTDGEVRGISAENVTSGNTARTNRINSTAKADKTATSAYTMMASKADTTSLLNRRITANFIKAVARTDATTSRMHSTAKDSQFGGLQVLGRPVNNVLPNTTIPIPGFGHVLLREVDRSGDGVHRSIVRVNMIHLFITQANTMHVPVGTEIVVGHAKSAYRSAPYKTLFNGYAFATSGTTDSSQANNHSGRSAAIYLGCTGTDGVTVSNDINQSSAVQGLRSGTGFTSVLGGVNGSIATAVTKSTVSDVSMLGGRIKADEVRGVARTTWDRSTNRGTNDFSGSQLVGLRVNGVPIDRNVAPNTRVNLPGIGYVLLNHRTTSSTADSTRTAITMIEVHVTATNDLHLPVGSTFLVGVAHSGVTSN